MDGRVKTAALITAEICLLIWKDMNETHRANAGGGKQHTFWNLCVGTLEGKEACAATNFFFNLALKQNETFTNP